MDLRIPPLKLKIALESNPLISTIIILVPRLAEVQDYKTIGEFWAEREALKHHKEPPQEQQHNKLYKRSNTTRQRTSKTIA